MPLFPHTSPWNIQEQLYLFTVNYYIGEASENFIVRYIEFL
jgi:hypothetical protein